MFEYSGNAACAEHGNEINGSLQACVALINFALVGFVPIGQSPRALSAADD